jgi:hypothetical protein
MVSRASRCPPHAATKARRVSGVDQRHIAREHQHHAVIGQQRHGLLHGVAGAELRHLPGELQAGLPVGAAKCCLHGLRPSGL